MARTTLLTPSNLKAAKMSINGLDEFVEKLNQKSVDIDKMFAKAVDEIKEGIREELKDWASNHKETGQVYESINASETYFNGFSVYAYVGVDTRVFEDAWHAVFVEYGTPTQTADPKIRATYAKWQRKSKAIYKKYFKEALK